MLAALFATRKTDQEKVMTIYLCLSLIAIGLMVLIGYQKAALVAALLVITGGFAYRWYAGEEIRAVVADALFCAAILPIGWWAAKQWFGITDQPASSN